MPFATNIGQQPGGAAPGPESESDPPPLAWPSAGAPPPPAAPPPPEAPPEEDCPDPTDISPSEGSAGTSLDISESVESRLDSLESAEHAGPGAGTGGKCFLPPPPPPEAEAPPPPKGTFDSALPSLVTFSAAIR